VNKIPLNTKFLADDRAPDEAEGDVEDVIAENAEGDESAAEDNAGDDGHDSDDVGDVEDDQEALNWDDVYGAVTAATSSSKTVPVSDSVTSASNSKSKRVIPSDDETEVIKMKTPRMKTNKKKATNFFTTANVKNKNPARRGIKLGTEHGRNIGKKL